MVAIFPVHETSHTLVAGAASTWLGTQDFRRLEEAYRATLGDLEFPLERGMAFMVDTKTKSRRSCVDYS